MKENIERVFVSPAFKRILKMEAASHGMSIIKFTEEVASQGKTIENIAENWKEKWKLKTKRVGFDFP